MKLKMCTMSQRQGCVSAGNCLSRVSQDDTRYWKPMLNLECVAQLDIAGLQLGDSLLSTHHIEFIFYAYMPSSAMPLPQPRVLHVFF